jgi:hypothetical protein
MRINIYKALLFLPIIAATLIFSAFPALASASGSLGVVLERPAGTMKMGDTPSFIGTITNNGQQPLEGLVVYLSLVSLKPGNEHPVDLEDWSAQKAVRIDRLSPGKSITQTWGMRLIQAGKFAVALTVVDPQKTQPTVSDLVPFEINPKPMIASTRILPVAIGEPFLLLTLLAVPRVLLGKRNLCTGIRGGKVSLNARFHA